MKSSLHTYGRLLRYTRPYWKGFATAIAAMIVAAATEPLFPALMKPLLDQGFVARESIAIWVVPAAIIGIFIVRGLATFSGHYALAWVSYHVLADVRRQMFSHMMRLPSREFEREASGLLISRIVFEVNNFTEAATHVITVLVRDSLVVLGLLAWLFWLNWKLTLIALLLVPALAIVIGIVSKRMRQLSRRSLEQMGELTRVVEEGVQGYKVIKIYDAYERQGQRFDQTVRRLRSVAMRMVIAGATTTPITQLCAAVAVATVVSIALMQSDGNQTTVGGFVSFITAMLMLLAPLKHLADINAPLQRGLASAEKVFELLDRQTEPDPGTQVSSRARGQIEFDRVCFQHPGAARESLSDISLHIAPGEVIALVGPSGGGKTTLLNLLPRFHEPVSGEVRIDGLPINSLKLQSLRAQMSLVSQETVLFNDTVRANLAVAVSQTPSDQELWAALAVAALDDVVRQLPQGLDTEVGERGTRFSGGQRQRLAIARAVLKNAPILLLDEATSALDSGTERAVQTALERVMRGRTTLVIAHRLSTIERADRILVIDAGRIVEQGSHAQLLALDGLYARLHGLQQSGSAEDPAHADKTPASQPTSAA